MKFIKKQILKCIIIILLGIVRLMVLILPFRIVAKLLVLKDNSTKINRVNRRQYLIAYRYGKLITAMAKRMPWKCQCLVQAITAQWLLRCRRLPTVINLGIKRGESNNGLEAHAWCQFGELVITGARERGGFYAF